MGEKNKYQTKQRQQLIAYLETIPGIHFTIADIVAYFKEQNVNIGTTTIYRQVEKLVEEGYVKKYIFDANTPACFEYMDPSKECMEDICFHCKCIQCGRLIHLHCDDLEHTEKHILDHHGFKIDARRSVFYGVCDQCQ